MIFRYFFPYFYILFSKTGYKEIKLDQFEGSYQPSKTLLKNWLESSNGSEMGIEMLLACLKELRRFDVIDVINDSEGTLINYLG